MQGQQNSQAAGSKHCREGQVTDGWDSTDLETPISDKAQPATVQSSALKADICPPSDSCPQSAVLGVPDIVPENADPLQLQSYPPAVRDIIERAKQFSHCDIASVNSFPL